MSKFFTKIPVDIESVKKLFPADHFLHKIEWDGECVSITWESDSLKTAYTFPLEYPLSMLTNVVKDTFQKKVDKRLRQNRNKN